MEKFEALKIASLDDDDTEEVKSIDEEEEEELEYVYLGFVEKAENSLSLLRHAMPSKAGGLPAWLDPENLPSERSFLCDICEEPLSFLMQVYAPDDGTEDTFHRTLFVFICNSMACLRCDQQEQWKRPVDRPSRCVKVFRCQLPQNNPFYPPQKDEKPATGGAELCTWCGTWKGIRRCSSCSKAVYCSKKHQVKHSQLGHDYDCQRARISSEPTGNAVVQPKAACTTRWPEFQIIEEYEQDFDVDGDESSNSMVSKTNTKDDDGILSVMKAFECNDEEKKSWASFKMRISWAPEQVMRYSRGPEAKPLWPSANSQPSKKDIPPCRYCNGPMCFEFQILPQLLYYFRVRNEANSLDWSTIAVYTCEASCRNSVVYKEEFAFVQLA